MVTLIALCLIGSLAWEAWACVCAPSVLDVAIGASTCAGANASPFSATWQGQLLASIQSYNPADNVLSLCGANNTGNMIPTGMTVPNCSNNAGSVLPDTAHNITAALSHSPNAVIMYGGEGNFITGNFCTPNTVADIEASIVMIANAAASASVPLYMTSAGPESTWNASQKANAAAVDSWIAANYPTQYINTGSVLDDGSGGLKAIYDSGDGIHPNNAGYLAVFQGPMTSSSLFNIR